jgi:hypothetical protein
VANRLVVNGPAKLAECIARLTALYRQHKYVKLTVSTGKDRTLDQNALWFGMYKRAAEMIEAGDAEEVRKLCKLEVGVRILLRDSPDFHATWFRLFAHLSYEEKLELMGGHPVAGPEGLPVTRLFDRKQGIEYTERVAAKLRAQGVYLDDLLSEEAA